MGDNVSIKIQGYISYLYTSERKLNLIFFKRFIPSQKIKKESLILYLNYNIKNMGKVR